MIIIDYKFINIFENLFKNFNKEILVLYTGIIKKVEKNNYYYIDKNNINIDISTIINIKNYNIFIQPKIKEELNYLGYNPKYSGTQYILETIYLLLNKDSYIYSDNLEKNIYPIIARKYHKSVNTIKCNIINATNIMICECEENKLIKYLGYYSFSKPGPKKIIECIVSKISNKNNLMCI